MKTIGSQEMYALDLNCEYFGLSRLQLMENAGRGLAEEIVSRFDCGKVVIYAGTGNNGGDAFVAARFLRGFDVEIVLSGEVRSDIALKNLEILKKSGFSISKWGQHEHSDSDIAVDALIGTGFRGKLREPYRTIVEEINASDSFTVSVDVPTGVDADTGRYEEAVRANLTVTFHRMKPGLIKAEDVTGEIVVKDIGIPDLFERLVGPGDFRITFRRFSDGHKGDHGKVLVVGGGEYVGAPFLSALAALKAGADLVTLAVPESVYYQVSSFSPEIIPVMLEGSTISMQSVPEIADLAERHDVVVFGMGTLKKGEIAKEISKTADKMVVDAGGLTDNLRCDSILTPHRGEFIRVFGMDADQESVRKVSKKVKATLLLKGREDIISDGERLKINRTGNAGMTVGGTGDVLAGVAGALFALNDDPFRSACSAAFVTGLAGDMCFGEMGYCFTAMDVIDRIPYAIKKICQLK